MSSRIKDAREKVLDMVGSDVILPCHQKTIQDLVDAVWNEASLSRDDLIHHCWIHSAYPNCGYSQMTTEQKILFNESCENHRKRNP